MFFSFHSATAGRPHFLNRQDVYNAVRAATDETPSDALVNRLLERAADGAHMSLDDFRALLTSDVLFPQTPNRCWVAVSLAEAETIRCILHGQSSWLAQRSETESGMEVALRYSPISAVGAPSAGDGGVIFDASLGWQTAVVCSRNSVVSLGASSGAVPSAISPTGATAYEAAVAHCSMRFFDCDMFFSEPALNILVRVLRSRSVFVFLPRID